MSPSTSVDGTMKELIMTTRVRTLSLHTPYTDNARRAMRAACAPFGSLTDTIADLAVDYLSAGCSSDAGIALVRATRAVSDVDPVPPASTEWSEVLLGASRVQLITPTSGTVIELRRDTGGWTLTAAFGARGSHQRADQILEHDTAAPDLAWGVTPIESTSAAEIEPAPGWEERAIERATSR